MIHNLKSEKRRKESKSQGLILYERIQKKNLKVYIVPKCCRGEKISA